MKLTIAILALSICLQSYAQPSDSLQSKTLSPTAMQQDFAYLLKLLQQTHPGLYRYTSKEEMQSKWDSSQTLLQSPMSFYDFYKIIASTVADIHCAHTQALPVKDLEPWFNSYIKTIPFFLYPAEDKIYVILNLTPDTAILPGYEVLSINGQSIDEIKKIVTRYYWADGFIQSSKNQVLQGQLFDIFYYSFVARPDTFHLTFKTLTGDTISYTTPAQTFASALKWIKSNPVNQQMDAWYDKKREKHPWRLTFPDDVPATAMLRFDGFGGEGANTEEEAQSTFRAFMDKSLKEIKKKNCTSLIIDVRANSGGWDNQGIELFTYLMKSDSAVRYYRRQHSITDSSEFLRFSDLSPEEQKGVKEELTPEPDGTFTLRENKNPTLQPQSPKPNRFKGNVYVLVDEKTFSTAAEFTAAAQANKEAVFVGEESGGCYEGGNSGSFIHLQLPNSGIAIGIPLVSYNMNVGEAPQKGRGTLPDYRVLFTLNDILHHIDPQLNLIKSLIRK